MSQLNRVNYGSVVEYFPIIQPLTFAFLAPVCQPYFTGCDLRSFNGIPVCHHEHLLARHWVRLPVFGLLSPLYGLMASRYRRG